MTAANSTFVAAYANFVRSNYFNLSSRVVFLWDYCITFDDEVRYVWGARLTPATALFMVNRYVGLVITILEFLEQAPVQTAQSCGPFIRLIQSLLVLALFIYAVFATLRIYAIWGCDWRPAAPVLILALVAPIFNIVIYASETPAVAPPPSVGCAVYTSIGPSTYSKLIIAARSATSAYDAIVFMLTLVKTIGFTRRGHRTGVGHLLIKDGAIYFLVLLLINLAQIVMSAALPGNDNISYYVSPVTSLLISRFLFDLREVAGEVDGTNRRSGAYLTSELPNVYATNTERLGMSGLAGPLDVDDAESDTARYLEESHELKAICKRTISDISSLRTDSEYV